MRLRLFSVSSCPYPPSDRKMIDDLSAVGVRPGGGESLRRAHRDGEGGDELR